MNGKRWVLGGLSAAVLAGGLLWGGQAHAWGRRHTDVGMEGALPVIAMIKKAELTEEQERQVGEILRAHRVALEEKSARAAEARRAVMGQLTADAVDAAALGTAMDQAAAAGKELALEWAQVRREVQALLTPEQVAELQALRDKFLKRVDERHADRQQRRAERLDRWIERLSR